MKNTKKIGTHMTPKDDLTQNLFDKLLTINKSSNDIKDEVKKLKKIIEKI